MKENKPKTHCTVEMVSNSEYTGTSLQFFKNTALPKDASLVNGKATPHKD